MRRNLRISIILSNLCLSAPEVMLYYNNNRITRTNNDLIHYEPRKCRYSLLDPFGHGKCPASGGRSEGVEEVSHER